MTAGTGGMTAVTGGTAVYTGTFRWSCATDPTELALERLRECVPLTTPFAAEDAADGAPDGRLDPDPPARGALVAEQRVHALIEHF